MNEIRLSGAASLLGKGEAQKTLRVKDMKAGAPLGGCRQNGWKDSVAETGIPAANAYFAANGFFSMSEAVRRGSQSAMR